MGSGKIQCLVFFADYQTSGSHFVFKPCPRIHPIEIFKFLKKPGKNQGLAWFVFLVVRLPKYAMVFILCSTLAPKPIDPTPT
jgi:hypothetical protein